MQKGVLRGKQEHVDAELFKEPYEWMMEQMKKRIGNPPDGVTTPVWA